MGARQTGPWYIGGDDDENMAVSDSESDSDKRKKKKRHRSKKKKLSKKEIENADIVQIDLGEEIKVGPKQNNLLKVDKTQLPKKSKKYTVLTKDKKKRKRTHKITANTVDVNDYVNTLSYDVDLSSPIDPTEMPTIKPYNQDEIVYKETKTSTNENEQKEEKSKKRKSKKQRKKDKKKEKKQRKKDKKNKKKKKKKSAKQEDDADDLLQFATTQKTADDGDDLLGFMNNNNEKKQSDEKTDDFINDLLDLSNGNNANHDDVKEEEIETKSSKKSKNKKTHKHKNGMMNGSETKQILFEDDSIRISYFAHPSNKKAATYLDIILMTENLSTSKQIKSAKLSLSKSSSFKPKEKTMDFKLCKKLEPNSENMTTIKMKCIDFGTKKSDSIKCKVSYNKISSKSLYIKLETHFFVTNEFEIKNEENLMKIVEEKCEFKASDRLKLPDSISCGNALDLLVKIWRVHNITMTDKKSTYYGKLMQNNHLAVYVKTNKKKNAIQITLSGHKQEFLDNMLEEFKSILLN